LGVGAVSSVNVCIKRSTHVRYAVKIVNKSSLEVRDRVLKEVEILYACSTSKLFLKLEDFFETNESFYLVFDKMAGPLLALIQKRERFTEREASLVTREVASGLAFLHERGIAHRDLKPENILCEKANEVVPIKICDFDLSSMITNQSTTTPNLFTPVGSAEYMAPEVVDIFRGDTFSYDKKCDLWSLGVLLYMMLSGSPPFNAKCLKDCGWERGMNCEDCQVMLMKKITAGDYTFPQEIWGKISSEAKDLISKLLEINAERRLSANETLRHAWLNEAAVIPDTPLTTPKVLKRLSCDRIK
jgi:MAP kinase interacting serine/threonine kinase